MATNGVTAPPVEVDTDGNVVPTDPARFLVPVDSLDGYWYEIVASGREPSQTAEQLGPMLSEILGQERDTLRLAKQLASRYEEIELLYTITETLGRTIHLEEAAQKIVTAVSTVVGAQRASILVHDPDSDSLRPVACVGRDVVQFDPVPVADRCSIAAKVFREGNTIMHDPRDPDSREADCSPDRGYRGTAFLSVPITYPGPDGEHRPVGVINLTDRIGTDAFSGGERRLVHAAASQIGAAIENSRLVARDLEQQRLRQELDLAHDLQLKLLPSPAILGPSVDAAAHFQPAESVGGDFYNFVRLPLGRMGVMLGDVSSHGFSSALMMALAMSAAGIHAAEAMAPDDALRGLLESIRNELSETEMHLAVFYGVADPRNAVLRYANAGHPHAFRVGKDGSRERLGATNPPLGLTDETAIAARETAWNSGEDVLVLFSDGIVDATNADDEKFGEDRVLDIVERYREASSEDAVEAVMNAVTEFSTALSDDRTVVLLRA